MIRQIIEGQLGWLVGVDAADIPDKLPAGISVHLRSGAIGLESQGIVGSIFLRNGDTVHILPKIGEVNFLRLLFKAESGEELPQIELDDFVKYSEDNESSFSSLVSQRFLVSLDDILRKSPLQGRASQLREEDFVLGEIHALKTAINLARRRVNPVASFLKSRTFDIPENRLLTESLIRAWHHLPAEARRKYQAIYQIWMKKFVRSKDIASDLAIIDQRFAIRGYGGSRDYYKHALSLAKIILGSSGIGFGSHGEIMGSATLLNTSQIFEKYIRRVISDAYAPKGYVVAKGGLDSKTLYTNGSFELVPDIVVSRNGSTILLADAKYKKPTNADHYQMATYMAYHKVEQGIMLAPLSIGNSVVIKEYLTPNRTIVREIYLPMNNLSETQSTLSTLIESYSHKSSRT
ncbi:5-methylcytosine restriction system specificity protein McrC [Cellvibrio sp. UBA7661]|uniref:5-methylcytosine restriction system specificity protein McrC n=1 Tax=Cellvibrio sp. UBA7661 TaxID=1946311 RepID=UPI002F3552FA